MNIIIISFRVIIYYSSIFNILGPPSPFSSTTISRGCLRFIASWEPITGRPVCGPVSYDVTISPSDGVMMMRITDTSYNFTGLTPNNTYTVTVAGTSDIGVGESSMMTTVAGDFDKLIHICMLACINEQLIFITKLHSSFFTISSKNLLPFGIKYHLTLQSPVKLFL